MSRRRPRRKKRMPEVQDIHPNSMAAKKWGQTQWLKGTIPSPGAGPTGNSRPSE